MLRRLQNQTAGEGRARNPIGNLATPEIVDTRRNPDSSRQNGLCCHRPSPLPNCLPRACAPFLVSPLDSLISDDPLIPAFGELFRNPSARNSSGARNPACSANSARALPEGSRQLPESSHSTGI